MRRQVENPKKYIISCRLNEEEMALLQQVAKQSGSRISELLRHSLGLQEEPLPTVFTAARRISEPSYSNARKAS